MAKKTDTLNQPGDKSASDKAQGATKDWAAKLDELTDKWKRALAEAENARKRAEAASLDGREHGVALAVAAFAPAYDDICLAIEAAHASLDADDPAITAHLEGLNRTKTAFESALNALGVTAITPKSTAFDPARHEAIEMQETEKTKPGEVLALHRPGFLLGQRLIRPAHVTVSASPSKKD